MKQVKGTALLPYTADQMFLIVNDVRSYPEFLPWCVGTDVIAADAHEMTARLTVAKAGFRQSFTTRNRLQRPTSIEMALLEGPFKMLRGGWQFHALGAVGNEGATDSEQQGCRVELNLCFEFDHRLANLAFGKVFQFMTDTMVDAFCARADALYSGDAQG